MKISIEECHAVSKNAILGQKSSLVFERWIFLPTPSELNKLCTPLVRKHAEQDKNVYIIKTWTFLTQKYDFFGKFMHNVLKYNFDFKIFFMISIIILLKKHTGLLEILLCGHIINILHIKYVCTMQKMVAYSKTIAFQFLYLVLFILTITFFQLSRY